MPAAPLVSVVIVNYNGEAYLRDLLPTLFEQTYPRFEIVVVDNASTDSSSDLLCRMGERVSVVNSGRNLGFAGGNNLGVRVSNGAYVALLNSDTVVHPDWLGRLVEAIETDPAVAAVGSKITFLKPFVPLTLRCVPRSPASEAESDVWIAESTRIEGCDYVKPLFDGNFEPRVVEAGRGVRRLRGCGELRLPFEGRGDQVVEVVAATASLGADILLRVELGQRLVGEARLTSTFSEHRFRLREDGVSRLGRYVINNAGSFLDTRGVAGDRGIYEPDEGQYDEPGEVQALCGCAMLIRRSVFEAVGGFDAGFFMYFEDVDLSWRLRRRGYRLLYQPAAVVRHVHAGTSTEGSPLFAFCTGRNRLLMLLKSAPWSAVAGAWSGELRHAAALLWAWWRSPRAEERRSAAREGLWLRVRILASALVRAPGAVLRRWEM